MYDGEAGDATAGGVPTITGLSPLEGTPGTQITIRGENLGVDQSDLLMLFVCGTDCLHTAKWHSSSKIVARIGQANRGLGEVKIATKSGGRGVSNVKFRVFIQQVLPLEGSCVWVDETRTVPGREAIRSVAQVSDERDALGMVSGKKMDAALLTKEFPDGSGNLRMESFNPQWYLLESHQDKSIEDFRQSIRYMEVAKQDEVRKNEQMHKANLFSLINCVDTLAALQEEIDRSASAGEFNVIKQIGSSIGEAQQKAENVFKDVLTRKDKADATRNALSVLTRFKFIFFLSKSIDDNMAKREYLTILNDYTRAKSLYRDTEIPLFKEVLRELDEKMDTFKEDMKHKLIDTPASFEEQSKLIKYLKILEPDSDPTWECVSVYHRWLEDQMWTMQNDYAQKAIEASRLPVREARYSLAEIDQRNAFVSSMLSFLLNKLQSFWKLASMSNAANDNNSQQRHNDINQMVTNTINVCSWLIVNALLPKLLPDSEKKRYAEQFAMWPVTGAESDRIALSSSLSTIRSFISSLLENHFTTSHALPLMELCMTMRVKVVSDMIDKGVASIAQLGIKENWRQEVRPRGPPRTTIADLYENEVAECISRVREALSTTGFHGEACIFSRERFRASLIELFVHLLTSIRHCYDRLLQLQRDKRPNELRLNDDEAKPNIYPKYFLISVCNMEHIVETVLKNLRKRMTDSGVKCVDEIYAKSRDKLDDYRKSLIKHYVTIKCSAFEPLIKSATYDYLPHEDVSDYAKEIVMCCVLEQAELKLCAPQLVKPCLEWTVEWVVKQLLQHMDERRPTQDEAVQCVIDLCALEVALDEYATLDCRTKMNAFRATLVGTLDQRQLQRCLTNMTNSMRMALDSLGGNEDDLNTSNI